MMKNLADGREHHINHAILISLVFDGEENRVLEMQDEGFMPGYEEKTVFISNYYEETIRSISYQTVFNRCQTHHIRCISPLWVGLTNSIPGAITTRMVNVSR